MGKASQNIKRVALYMRVSTIEQARDGYGLDSQDRILRAFVKANEDIGWLTSENLIYRDEGISGTTEVQDRPELTRLRNDIIDGKVDVLLVWKIDRLFRKTAYLLDFIEFLKTHNINFVSKNENIDLSSPTGKLVLTLLGAISEMERDVITERTHEWKLSKALQGYFVYGNTTPYGYKKVHDGKWNIMTIDEDEAPIVWEIFDMYTREWKWTGEIARILTARGIGTRRDHELENNIRTWKVHKWLFRQSVILEILKSTAYIGKYYCNKFEVTREDGVTRRKLKDESEWVLLPCDSIVEEKIWLLAQEKISKWKVISGRWEKHIFTWLLKCEECGKAFNYYKSRKWTGNYRCGGKKKDKVCILCKNKDISEEKLLKYLKPYFESILLDAEWFIKKYEATVSGDSGKKRQQMTEKELLQIEETLKKKAEIKKQTLRKSIENPQDEEIYTSILIDIWNEQGELLKRQKELKDAAKEINKREELYISIRGLSEKYKERFDKVDEKDMTEFVNRFIDKILIGKDKLEVEMRVWK